MLWLIHTDPWQGSWFSAWAHFPHTRHSTQIAISASSAQPVSRLEESHIRAQKGRTDVDVLKELNTVYERQQENEDIIQFFLTWLFLSQPYCWQAVLKLTCIWFLKTFYMALLKTQTVDTKALGNLIENKDTSGMSLCKRPSFKWPSRTQEMHSYRMIPDPEVPARWKIRHRS